MSKPQIAFDDLIQPHWNEQQKEKAKAVIDFVQNLMNEHNFEHVLQSFGKNKYIQHNRNIPDGITQLVENLKQLTKNFPEFSYDIKRISVDGSFVTLHAHATMRYKDRGNDRKGLNIHDCWRLEGVSLVEHWDSVQPIDWFMRLYGLLTGGKIANNNGVF